MPRHVLQLVLRSSFGALLLAAAVFLVVRPLAVEVDLFSLVQSSDRAVMSALMRRYALKANLIIDAPTPSAALVTARAICSAAQTNTSCGVCLAPVNVSRHHALLDELTTFGGGLLTPATREKLRMGDTAAIRTAAIRQLVSGFTVPLVSVAHDPFLLITDYIMQLPVANKTWTLHDGFLMTTMDNRSYIMLPFDLSTIPIANLPAAVDALNSLAADISEADTHVLCCGAPFHTVRAMMSSQREINILSIISVLGVLVLGWRLFRTPRILLPILLGLACSALLATATLFLCFSRPHALVFVFGTSLIGLSIDYSYHYFTARRAAASAEEAYCAVGRNMTFALLTTIGCFIPLFFSSVTILRQMALFTVAGLVGVYACVMFFYSLIPTRLPPAPPATPRVARKQMPLVLRGGILVATVLFIICGVWRVRVANDPSAFYTPDAQLLANDMRFIQLNGAQHIDFTLVKGATLEDALQREELYDLRGLSAFIPSVQRQRENATLIDTLYTKEFSALCHAIGLQTSVPRHVTPLLTPDGVTNSIFRVLVDTMTFHADDAWYTIITPATSIDCANDPAITTFAPRTALTQLFDTYARETYRLLAIAFVMMLVILFALFRARALSYLLPVALAIGCTLAILGFSDVPVNLFHWLSFFILIGLGLDYTIFHFNHPAPQTFRTVRYAFLTSFLGLGMLVFTQFAVTRAIGFVLAVGLACAYGFSLMLRPRDDSVTATEETSSAWYKQHEQSAGVFRIWAMWIVYRIFGKHVMKIILFPGMLFIYFFSRPARKALAQFFEVLFDYARNHHITVRRPTAFGQIVRYAYAMTDKVDVCTLRRNLPAMTARENDDWRTFCATLEANRGAFFIGTHVGEIEVFPAVHASFPHAPQRHMHAFQQLSKDNIFVSFFRARFSLTDVTIHPVEEINIATAVAMKDALERGELVMMAGDRLSANTPSAAVPHIFLDRPCMFPKGVFRFARAMECPVFFIACVKTAWNRYEIHVADATTAAQAGNRALLDAYVAFLERETVEHPEQWFHFFPFFGALSEQSK